MVQITTEQHRPSLQTTKGLQEALDNVTFTCGAQIGDLELGEKFSDVYAMQIRCNEPIKKLYYSSKYEPICIYCSSDENLVENNPDRYPQCTECAEKEPIN